ncbi:MAG TPA: hypothetical protein DEA91_21760 [Paenibacillus sp.]|nr:hypothetical protein [Paenibacillus sp.]
MTLTEQGLKERNLLYRPIKFVMIYFIGLIILYIWGPLEWKTQNSSIFYLFLFLAHGLLILGYKSTMAKMRNKEALSQNNYNTKLVLMSDTIILKWINVLIIINLIMTFLFLIRTIGLSSFSINSIINNLLEGIADPGGQYNSKFTTAKIFGGNILAPLSTLLAPILWPVIPISIIYYKRLNLTSKILVIITIIVESIRWISTGTNKGVIDLILIIISLVFLKQLQRGFNGIINKKSRGTKIIRGLIIIVVLIVVGFSVFENNISSRINNNFGTVSSISNNTELNFESPIMKISPSSMHTLLIYTTSYLTQGYYGLSLALDEPFIPMFGIGNSYFLISNFEGLLNMDIWKYTYQSRIAYEGWNPFVNWHSIYTWLANDFSYFGVLILMFLLGKYFAIVCYRSIVYKDPITSTIFCLLVICFFYFPCNNQVLSMPSTFMAFWGLNIYWFYKTKIKKTRG